MTYLHDTIATCPMNERRGCCQSVSCMFLMSPVVSESELEAGVVVRCLRSVDIETGFLFQLD